MSKVYKFAVVCGRFQPIHNGHVDIIRKAIEYADVVGLYIGSANRTGTKVNPLSYEDRKELIEKIFPEEVGNGRLIIKPLYDREHPADDLSWGKHYLGCIQKDFGEFGENGRPDLFVYGNDKVRGQWFTEEDLKGIDTLVVNRKSTEVSGTEVREKILDREFFEKSVPEEIWEDWEKIKTEVMNYGREC